MENRSSPPPRIIWNEVNQVLEMKNELRKDNCLWLRKEVSKIEAGEAILASHWQTESKLDQGNDKTVPLVGKYVAKYMKQ